MAPGPELACKHVRTLRMSIVKQLVRAQIDKRIILSDCNVDLWSEHAYVVCAVYESKQDHLDFLAQAEEIDARTGSVRWYRAKPFHHEPYLAGGLALFLDESPAAVEFTLRWHVSVEELIRHSHG